MPNQRIFVKDMNKLRKSSKPANYKAIAKTPRKSYLAYHNVYLYNEEFVQWLELKKIPHRVYTPEAPGRLFTLLEYED